VIGAVFTLLSCLAGEVFAVIQMAASSHNLGFFDALPHVDFSILVPTVLEHMSLLDYVIYGIGVYEGYQFSFRKLTPQEIQEAGLASTPTTS
jgi:hypothetical protein